MINSESPIWHRKFWKAATERAIRNAVGTLLAMILVAGFNPLAADWINIGATVGWTLIISYLLSIFNNGITKKGPSFGGVEHLPPDKIERG